MNLPQTWRDGELAEPPYFYGVYDAAELEQWDRDDPFASAGWLDHCVEYARTLGLGGDPDSAPRRPWARSLARRLLRRTEVPLHLQYPLAIVRQTIAEAGSVSVLDFGGGFGDNFTLLTRWLEKETAGKIDYCVVDNAASIELGRALYATRDVRPRFAAAIPDERFDLVLAIGSLEYVSTWRQMCATLRARSRRHLFITRAPLAERVATFYTIQSVCPAMGRSALRQVGLARVAVINKSELNSAVTQDGWTVSHARRLEDYSPHFARLPKPYDRGIIYAALAWRAPVGQA